MLSALVFAAVCMSMPGLARAACDAPVASIVSLQGQVEVSRAGATQWHPAEVGQGLCPGELVTVRKQSRATVLFEGDVLTRLDQYTTLEVAAPPKDGDAALGLREGIAHVISRLRKRVEVISPVVNALVEGTEFTVVAQSGHGRVVVAEGRVRVSNAAGETRLLAGEAADVSPNTAPTKLQVQPLDTIHWAIYYPIVVWPGDASLKAARALGVQAKYPEALAKIAGDQSAAAAAYRANLELALGRFDDAGAELSANPESKALAAIIAVAQGRVAEARSLIDEALSAQADSAPVQLADSHVCQAEGRLDAALAAARRATERMTDNPLAWARRAELELSLARVEDGRQSAAHALELSPKTVRAKAMLGFADVLAGRYGEALNQLQSAIADNPADPLAHFALGLARIRQGELAQGRRDLEIAVLLDPSNVEYRSSLGRAYMAEDQDKHAATQLDLAARLDPASPTPLFFDAQRRLTGGDVIGAIDDASRALALNDNRLTLRSPALLATDRAARGTTLGSAYQAAGFDSALKRIASDAVEADPASGPAHRLMAQAYTDDRRLENARVSEQFQSFVYGDIGQPMAMPQELVTALPVLDGARVMSLNETAAVFDGKPYQFSLSGLVGSQESWGTSVMASAHNDRFQASLGHFDYRSDGFAENADVDVSATRAEFRGKLTSDLMFFGDILHKDVATSDITQALYTINQSASESERSDLARVGLRYRLSPSDNLVFLASNETGHTESSSEQFPSVRLISFGFFKMVFRNQPSVDAGGRFSNHNLGVRWNGEKNHLSYDIGFIQNDRKETSDQADTNSVSINGVPINSLPTLSETREDARSRIVFGQLRWNLAAENELHLGLVHTDYNNTWFKYSSSTVDDLSRRDADRVSPSVGFVARDVLGTTFRGAIIQGVSVRSPGDQTLLPTRFAGFDAVFDDVDGTRFKRVALAFERKLSRSTTLGGEWSLRNFEVPREFCAYTDCLNAWAERDHHVVVTTVLSRMLGFETGWYYRSLNVLDKPSITYQPAMMRTETIPLRLFMQWPSLRVRATAEALRVRQDVFNYESAEQQRNSASFWMANIRLMYGAPRDRWNVGLDVRNLFDQDALIQDTDLVTADPRTPLWYPERSVFLTARVGF